MPKKWTFTIQNDLRLEIEPILVRFTFDPESVKSKLRFCFRCRKSNDTACKYGEIRAVFEIAAQFEIYTHTCFQFRSEWTFLGKFGAKLFICNKSQNGICILIFFFLNKSCFFVRNFCFLAFVLRERFSCASTIFFLNNFVFCLYLS